MTGRVLIFMLLSALSIKNTLSQGIYKEFGQNRIQYRQFEWKQLTYDNLDILYYDNEDMLAANALELAVKELSRLENFLSYKYGGAMQIVVFSSLTDYRQSNIGYTNPQLNSGGYLVIPNDVQSVYFNGSYADLRKQLRKAICDVMLREMIYGGTLQDRFERVRSPMLPAWFTEGLGAFLSESWSAEKENELINAFATETFANFNDLNRDETILAGHSIWRYLVEVYGAESVSTIVFISRYTHSAEAAIYFHTRKSMGEFIREWRDFYYNALTPAVNQNLPAGTSNIPGKISRHLHTDFNLSPDGKTVALVTNDQGQYDIWTFSLVSGKVKHVYSGGHKVLNQLPDFDFPRVKWNPGNGSLSFLTYETGKYRLMEQGNSGIREIAVFGQYKMVSDFAYNLRGDSVVLCAVNEGRSDLYLLIPTSGITIPLTSDSYEDRHAIFSVSGDIIFVSNRPLGEQKDVNYAGEIQNIFVLKNGVIQSMTRYTSVVNLRSIVSYSKDITGYLSDESGLFNAYAVSTDSGGTYGQTNYRSGVLAQCISSERTVLGELMLLNGRYHIFTSQVPDNPILESVPVTKLKWKTTIGDLDSLFAERNIRVPDDVFHGDDSVVISVIDSTKRDYHYQTGFPKTDYQRTVYSDSVMNFNAFKRSNFRNSLQPDFLLSQSENRVLGSYYQSNLIRRESLRNPLIMPYLKVSLSDILKNYIIETGIRTSLDLLTTDFTARFGVYKFRSDHDFTVSRHSRKYEDGTNILKQHLSTQLNYSVSWPFNEKSRFSAHAGMRYEYNSIKGSEIQNLNIPDIIQFYTTGRAEYTYDNTSSLGLNMMSGFRSGTGIDLMHLNNSNKTVVNFYTDSRLYIPVFRKIIWANRISAAYALGSSDVVYYLGAVENWTVKQQFAQGVPGFNSKDFLFQHWVSNLRGFSRGVRAGSNFALINTEIRIPVLQTIVTKPMESEFLRNFTVTGFADMGTAFIGKSPSDPANPFNTVGYSTPNYDITVTSRRNPYVLGTGYGIRTRIMGYFVKFDRAWGFMENRWQKPMYYISLGFDF